MVGRSVISVVPALQLISDQENVKTHKTGVIGTGSALPSRRISNFELSEHIDTTDEWIRERVGIGHRYICGADESSITLARDAARQAIAAAEIAVSEIDVVIFATVTPDRLLPSAAAVLLGELGIPNALAFDIRAACSGFLFGLATADSLLKSLNKRTALVIGAESLSRIIDWTDRNTCVLFGDGAGAAILRYSGSAQEQQTLLASYLSTDGSSQGMIRQTGGAFPPQSCPFGAEVPLQHTHPYVQMEGREVFRFGVNAMASSIEGALETAGKSIKDVSFFIPHQSNKRMIEAVSNRIGFTDPSRIALNLERIGNTSAASIPIALDEAVREKKIRSGDLVLLTAVGSGMTYGSVLLSW